MSGAEVVAGLIPAGVGAAAGVKTASEDSRSSKSEMTVVKSSDYVYAKGRGCEAFANQHGAYTSSQDGTAMSAWSGKYSSSRR